MGFVEAQRRVPGLVVVEAGLGCGEGKGSKFGRLLGEVNVPDRRGMSQQRICNGI